jgi:hypothetical protein
MKKWEIEEVIENYLKLLSNISGKTGTRRPVNLIDFPSLPFILNYEVNYFLRVIK